MDNEIERKVRETIELLRQYSVDDVNYDEMDPVAKMMLVALIHEEQKLKDDIDNMPQKILERFCSHFVPHEKICAMPAITLLHPTFRKNDFTDIISVGAGVSFTYRHTLVKPLVILNYIPIFKTTLIPYIDLYVVSHSKMWYSKGSCAIKTDSPNIVWVGIATEAEIESLNGLSLFIKGTGGVRPNHIFVGTEGRELKFSTIKEMENIEMVEPFDAQQASEQFFSFLKTWKEHLSLLDDTILYITDDIKDRDLFKPYAYPKSFRHWFEGDTLDDFSTKTHWIRLEFPVGTYISDSIQVHINVVPVTNVDINSIKLTQASSIAKLQKQEQSFFLRVLETSSTSYKEGFKKLSDEVLIRDFDAACYNNGDLYKDIRNLYNKFSDDYYAFIKYNEIKDGGRLNDLRKTINDLGKTVGQENAKYKFDSGTYVMRDIKKESLSSTIDVSYITTMGEMGNVPKEGDKMDSRNLPAINSRVECLISALGGSDKISPDARYELLRYYALTNDRLYTRMDVDAFLRKEIMATFGKEEFNSNDKSSRIFIKMNIQGAEGERSLRRGLYIDIEFKDKKNYEKAIQKSFGNLIQQKIEDNSCIAMPIIVTLVNLEG